LKRLIVTADDVGLHPGMTRGALAAHDRGIVTAVSVAANGRAFDDAVERLRDRPALDVGIHLVLVEERPLSPPAEVRSLLGRDGAFLPGFRAFARRYFLGGINPAEVETQLRRQIERLLATGLRVVHANGHQHLHVLPEVFEVVLRLTEEHGIPFVRLPREPAVARRWSPRSAQLAVLNHFGRRARRRWERAGRSAAPQRTIGLVEAGHLTAERLRRSLEHVEGLTELVCHPGLGGEALAAEYAWGYGWDEETAALCDPGLPELLRSRGIELTSFSRLPAGPAISAASSPATAR
jgi:chitin disaccharide deacetylase